MNKSVIGGRVAKVIDAILGLIFIIFVLPPLLISHKIKGPSEFQKLLNQKETEILRRLYKMESMQLNS